MRQKRWALCKRSCSDARITCGVSSRQLEDKKESQCHTCARTATVSIWKTSYGGLWEKNHKTSIAMSPTSLMQEFHPDADQRHPKKNDLCYILHVRHSSLFLTGPPDWNVRVTSEKENSSWRWFWIRHVTRKVKILKQSKNTLCLYPLAQWMYDINLANLFTSFAPLRDSSRWIIYRPQSVWPADAR